MIDIKTEKEIQIMAQGGHILAQVLDEVLKNVRVGVSELELDKLAEEEILRRGAKPAFKKVKNYTNAICVSTNNVVVHGIPTNYKFKEGDLVGIDCGVYFKGFNTDMAETRRVSTINNQQLTSNGDEVDKFLETGKKALNEAIKIARAGARVGHISKTIQDIVEGSGYSVVRNLVGHGIGKKLHEEPKVPGFLDTKINRTPTLKAGMTIAIEVIYNMGGSDVLLAKDGWTIETRDKSLSGVFERTIAITSSEPIVLTE